MVYVTGFKKSSFGMPSLEDFEMKNKTILVRVDLNSPIENGKLMQSGRFVAHAKTLKLFSKKGAKVVVLSHQGRSGKDDFLPLEKHAVLLTKLTGKKVNYINDIFGKTAQKAIKDLLPGNILLLENTRFFEGETLDLNPKKHSESKLVKNLAPFCDAFVLDAFSVAHRSHASTVGFIPIIPSFPGPVFEKELISIEKSFDSTLRPRCVILGGAKPKDSLIVADHLVNEDKADHILAGGLLGELFVFAQGYKLSKDKVKIFKDKDILSHAKALLKNHPEKIEVPVDLAVIENGKRKEYLVADLPKGAETGDFGKKTIDSFCKVILKSKKIIVNGPIGNYEKKEFEKGTKKILETVAKTNAFSLLGGGHTSTAIKEFNINSSHFSYISLSGKAFIEYLSGEKLPAIEALKDVV